MKSVAVALAILLAGCTGINPVSNDAATDYGLPERALRDLVPEIPTWPVNRSAVYTENGTNNQYLITPVGENSGMVMLAKTKFTGFVENWLLDGNLMVGLQRSLYSVNFPHDVYECRGPSSCFNDTGLMVKVLNERPNLPGDQSWQGESMFINIRANGQYTANFEGTTTLNIAGANVTAAAIHYHFKKAEETGTLQYEFRQFWDVKTGVLVGIEAAPPSWQGDACDQCLEQWTKQYDVLTGSLWLKHLYNTEPPSKQELSDHFAKLSGWQQGIEVSGPTTALAGEPFVLDACFAIQSGGCVSPSNGNRIRVELPQFLELDQRQSNVNKADGSGAYAVQPTRPGTYDVMVAQITPFGQIIEEEVLRVKANLRVNFSHQCTAGVAMGIIFGCAPVAFDLADGVTDINITWSDDANSPRTQIVLYNQNQESVASASGEGPVALSFRPSADTRGTWQLTRSWSSGLGWQQAEVELEIVA